MLAEAVRRSGLGYTVAHRVLCGQTMLGDTVAHRELYGQIKAIVRCHLDWLHLPAVLICDLLGLLPCS